MSVFSDRMTGLMIEKGLSQKQLSDRTGVTESAMSYYAKGLRTPRSDVLARIASALDTSVDYLLGNSDISDVQKSRELQYLQRNLGKLNPTELKKAEAVLKAVFDDIFDDDDGE